MIAWVAVFFLLVTLFGIVGSARGWAKEILVIASVILSLAVIVLLEDLLNLGKIIGNDRYLFYLRMFILTMLIYFGYQSPRVQRIAKATEKRAQIGERILSFLMGLLSGYFVVGTYWYYANLAGYPGLEKYIAPANQSIAEATVWVMSKLPPVWLDDPVSVFIALVLIFIFIIIYFV
jgi:hypothetical protein